MAVKKKNVGAHGSMGYNYTKAKGVGVPISKSNMAKNIKLGYKQASEPTLKRKVKSGKESPSNPIGLHGDPSHPKQIYSHMLGVFAATPKMYYNLGKYVASSVFKSKGKKK